jgi:hypothetical protein
MTDIFTRLQPIQEFTGPADALPFELIDGGQPFILRQFAANWPIVKAAIDSKESLQGYLSQYYTDRQTGAFISPKANQGRYFYNHDLSGFNFTKQQVRFDQTLDNLCSVPSLDHDYYLGSANIDSILPGLKKDNPFAGLAAFEPLTSIWLSSQSRIAAHQDHPQNIACCVAGERRFVLFPPEQLKNLYIGPLDFTPAGQAISLVDFHEPDLDKFPKFPAALEHGMIANLQPGDGLFIPSLWWHHIEALSDINMLMNFWWEPSDLSLGDPMDALLHSILNISRLSAPQKAAWQSTFEHYVFKQTAQDFSHIPPERRGLFGNDYKTWARQVRSFLLNRLNR